MARKHVLGFIPNSWRVILRIIMACVLLFVTSFFFFRNMSVFWDDLASFNPLPIFFFAGIAAVCVYISFLVSRSEDKQFHRADKFDLPYRVLFTVLLLYVCIRDFLIYPYDITPWLIIIACVAGVVNWLIPKTTYDDSF